MTFTTSHNDQMTGSATRCMPLEILTMFLQTGVKAIISPLTRQSFLLSSKTVFMPPSLEARASCREAVKRQLVTVSGNGKFAALDPQGIHRPVKHNPVMVLTKAKESKRDYAANGMLRLLAHCNSTDKVRGDPDCGCRAWRCG